MLAWPLLAISPACRKQREEQGRSVLSGPSRSRLDGMSALNGATTWLLDSCRKRWTCLSNLQAKIVRLHNVRVVQVLAADEDWARRGLSRGTRGKCTHGDGRPERLSWQWARGSRQSMPCWAALCARPSPAACGAPQQPLQHGGSELGRRGVHTRLDHLQGRARPVRTTHRSLVGTEGQHRAKGARNGPSSAVQV